MKLSQKSERGFTIVELIVVVLIIGILAAISIVSYSVVSRNAANASVMASVSSWEKNIKTYQAYSQKLPDDWTCLGMDVTDFPADPAYNLGPGMCERGMIVNDIWTSEFKTTPPQPSKPTSTPELLKQNTSPGSGATRTLTSGNKVIRGIIYASVSDPNQVNYPGAYIFYALDDKSCPAAEAFKIQGKVNVCARLLTKPGANWIDVIDV